MLTLVPNQPVRWIEQSEGNRQDWNPAPIHHQGVLAELWSDNKPELGTNTLCEQGPPFKVSIYVMVKHSFSGKLELIDTARLEDLPIRQD